MKQLINENRLNRIVSSVIKRYLNEGAYDYPDGVDGIILLMDNDRECHSLYTEIVRMLKKKKQKGVDLNLNVLAESSMMKKFQQFCFRKFKHEQEGMTKDSPRVFRFFVAERMINDANWL